MYCAVLGNVIDIYFDILNWEKIVLPFYATLSLLNYIVRHLICSIEILLALPPPPLSMKIPADLDPTTPPPLKEFRPRTPSPPPPPPAPKNSQVRTCPECYYHVRSLVLLGSLWRRRLLFIMTLKKRVYTGRHNNPRWLWRQWRTQGEPCWEL